MRQPPGKPYLFHEPTAERGGDRSSRSPFSPLNRQTNSATALVVGDEDGGDAPSREDRSPLGCPPHERSASIASDAIACFSQYGGLKTEAKRAESSLFKARGEIGASALQVLEPPIVGESREFGLAGPQGHLGFVLLFSKTEPVPRHGLLGQPAP